MPCWSLHFETCIAPDQTNSQDDEMLENYILWLYWVITPETLTGKDEPSPYKYSKIDDKDNNIAKIQLNKHH